MREEQGSITRGLSAGATASGLSAGVRGLLGYLGSKASQQSADAVGPGQRRSRTGREG